MIRIYSVEEAKISILRRKTILDVELSSTIKKSIQNIFGEVLTPEEVVQRIINDVKAKGDLALKKWTERIDRVDVIEAIEIPSNQVEQSLDKINSDIKQALTVASNRITAFHKNQPIGSWFMEENNGKLGQLVRPIQKIGIYVPGGTAPLPSSVLMSCIPAIIAGSRELIITTPPQRDGTISSIILATCQLLVSLNPSVTIRVFRIGGAQAIAAMAFGTESVPKVDKIVGPGNLFVSLAKKEVYGQVGIDGIAGPTEAMILADQTANPNLVAADLLAQAEHDILAIPILVTPSLQLAKQVQAEIIQQLKTLNRKTIIKESLGNQGGIVLTSSNEESISVVNDFAPEHLSIVTENPTKIVDQIQHAGGVFLGEISCEVIGDYVAGPSHVMPTGGSAKFASPLSVLDFVKVVSYVELDKETVNRIAKSAQIIAEQELLTAHAEAARRRKNE